MSNISTLKLNDSNEMKVLNCSWHFDQTTDATGKPNAIVNGGMIYLTVETDGSSYLFAWMTDPTMQKSGILTLKNADSESKLKTIEFNDAFCVSYSESFDSSGLDSRLICLSISPREFIMDETTYTKNWPKFVAE